LLDLVLPRPPGSEARWIRLIVTREALARRLVEI
jgi:hypothetical protein